MSVQLLLVSEYRSTIPYKTILDLSTLLVYEPSPLPYSACGIVYLGMFEAAFERTIIVCFFYYSCFVFIGYQFATLYNKLILH